MKGIKPMTHCTGTEGCKRIQMTEESAEYPERLIKILGKNNNHFDLHIIAAFLMSKGIPIAM